MINFNVTLPRQKGNRRVNHLVNENVRRHRRQSAAVPTPENRNRTRKNSKHEQRRQRTTQQPKTSATQTTTPTANHSGDALVLTVSQTNDASAYWNAFTMSLLGEWTTPNSTATYPMIDGNHVVVCNAWQRALWTPDDTENVTYIMVRLDKFLKAAKQEAARKDLTIVIGRQKKAFQTKKGNQPTPKELAAAFNARAKNATTYWTPDELWQELAQHTLTTEERNKTPQ